MSSYRLKIIAIVSMTIDHFGKVFGPSFWANHFPNVPTSTISNIGAVVVWIGRLAFPLFAFMIAEGCAKTHNMPKYMGRLALFAVISQPIYYLAFDAGTLADWDTIITALRSTIKPDNVFVTLTLGALTVLVFQKLKSWCSKWAFWLTLPALLILCLPAGILHSDYEGFGVALIFTLYLLPQKKQKIIVLIIWSVVFYALYASWNGSTLMWLPTPGVPLSFQIEISAFYLVQCTVSCLSAALVASYNGERGRRAKWVFYIFYPAHLLILLSIKSIVNGYSI